ncbi:hypothetical protein HPO_04445 [Hyphomonas polymorpha PS728]|uniref:Uncharacterized protein n=1 Tax=Hyphomonas polymorpha PS728 TaxID=1280954 RepID=A0A062VGQ8_9PROT|nr:hypothetical protein HPO_04445 [Hyphomonas polymorpha PS728]
MSEIIEQMIVLQADCGVEILPDAETDCRRRLDPIETSGFPAVWFGRGLSMELKTYAELVRGWDALAPENCLKLLVSDVPAALHQLIPYAQVFGITDDG